MKRIMGIALIVVGIAVIVGGIVMLTRSDAPEVAVPQNDAPRESVAVATPAAEDAVVPNVTEDVEPIADTKPEEVAEQSAELSAKEKGDAFEDFVVNLLADHRFKLLDRTQDAVSSAGVVAASSKNPDLHVSQKRGKSDIDYYVECKYRTRWTDNAITFEDWQLDRYRKFQRENRRKVIIALGVGGTADAPATFRLVPLDSVKGNAIRKIDTQFAVTPTSADFYNYINDYFNTVFEKSRKAK